MTSRPRAFGKQYFRRAFSPLLVIVVGLGLLFFRPKVTFSEFLCDSFQRHSQRAFFHRPPLRAIPSSLTETQVAVDEVEEDVELRRRAQEQISELEELAAKNDADAKFKLAKVYRSGRFVEKDLYRAYDLALEAAQQDHVRAQHLTGVLLIKGEGCEADEETGLYFLRAAAEEGFALAQHSVAMVYLKGASSEGKDLISGSYWLKQAANNGHAASQNLLGRMLLDGADGIMQNQTWAAFYFKAAALQGTAEAAEAYGEMLRYGIGIPKDEAQAVIFLESAAKDDDPEACYALGCMHRVGEGIQKDASTAIEWFAKAAELGHADAAEELGVMYLTGEGVSKVDEAGSAYYFRIASELKGEATEAEEEDEGLNSNPYAPSKNLRSLMANKGRLASTGYSGSGSIGFGF
eukprot:TRINITY_DN28015_c0_g1_i1.p1 TRINITY_DN28015_c0_g1~~TRINITY_DN28015_c0_g1_i1.p1  ORF type:complete len:406 (+),score=71.90 TRINITY_DN28015_c0_g1_i1:46-1263(+)